MKRINFQHAEQSLNSLKIYPYLETINLSIADCKNAVKLILDKICPNFEFNENLTNLYSNGVHYFTGQECDWDLKKGLMIIGNVGSGKSLFIKSMQIFTGRIIKLNTFKNITSRQITNGYLTDGYESMKPFLYNDNKPYHLAIDDIGRMDENVMNFGTKKNVIQEILADRYEIFKSHGKLTFVTTNLNSEKLEQYYGEWIRSRAREMFNIVKITGTDKRR